MFSETNWWSLCIKAQDLYEFKLKVKCRHKLLKICKLNSS